MDSEEEDDNIVVSADPAHNNEKINRPLLFWVLVLACGWLFDFLFWVHPVGLNFPLFSLIILGTGIAFLVSEGYKPAPRTLWLLVPLVFFNVVSFLRREPLTVFLAYTYMLFLTALFLNSYAGGRWFQYGLTDYVRMVLRSLDSLFTRQLGFLQRLQRERKENEGVFPTVAVLRGLLIAAPIVLFFAVLLASADAVFNQKIWDILNLLFSGRFFEYILRLLIILFCAWLLAGALLHAVSQSGDVMLASDEDNAWRKILGFTEASIILGSTAILFLLFVIIQIKYFFGGQSNIGIAGYTYSEYARRGFNELVIVAFFSLLLIMGLGTITKRETTRQQRVFLWLSVAVMLLVLVILTSAYQRLMLAIDWHGFSRLRLYPRVFLIWIGILFVAIVVLEIFHQERYFVFAFVLASLGFAISLTLLNVDAAIIKHNLLRVSNGKYMNVGHLASLSSDAIPPLVEAYHAEGLPVSMHEGIGAILLCYIHSDKTSIQAPSDWRSFNYSSWRAASLLAETEPLLIDYRVIGKGRTLRVRTPGNVMYDCQGIY